MLCACAVCRAEFSSPSRVRRASPDGLVQSASRGRGGAPGFLRHRCPAPRRHPSDAFDSDLAQRPDPFAALRCVDKRTLHYIIHEGERAYEIACDSVVFSSPRRPGRKAETTELEIEQKAGSVEGLQELTRVFEAFFAVVPRRSSSKYQDGLKALELI